MEAEDGDELQYAALAQELSHHHRHNQSSRSLQQDDDFWRVMGEPCPAAQQPPLIDGTTVPKADFNERFCVPEPKPALISGLTAHWPAMRRWTLDTLLETHGDTWFTIAGGRIKLRDYHRFVSSSHGDWPFYIFEEDFLEPSRAALLHDYQPHEYFDDQLRMPSCERPATKYFLIGPRGSGTHMHTDPMTHEHERLEYASRGPEALVPLSSPRRLLRDLSAGR